jgi:hypothetical protein
MVKHIVLWKLTDEAKKDADKIVADLNKRFKALLGVIDGLTAIEVGENYNGGKFDLMLYCEFSTREAQDNYQTHAAHVKVKESIHPLVCDRECVDYEI